MKTTILAAASIVALSVAGAAFAAPAVPLMPLADGTANTNAVVEQVGDSNSANVNQLNAIAATAVVIQGTGTTNANNSVAVVKQQAGSSGEQAVVLQSFNGNNANVYQGGQNERAGVLQYGNNNGAAITQTGVGNGSPDLWGLGFTNGANAAPMALTLATGASAYAADPYWTYLNVQAQGWEGVGILQVGDANSATTTQGGTHNAALTIQVGNSNLGNVTQTGSDGYAQLTQTGNNNTATVGQSAANDAALVYQNGTYNQAYVSQSTAAAWSTVAQSGFNNVTYVTQ